jgi:rhodanese-related sulfurtransferase
MAASARTTQQRETTMNRPNLTVLFTALSFCLAAAGAAHSEPADIALAIAAEANPVSPQVTTGEMRRIVQDGSAVILDTRTQQEFDAGHIPNAHAVDGAPEARLAAVDRLAKGDKTTALVLYCNGPNCQASRRFAEDLKKAGYSNIRRYQLGIPVWRALGGPLAIETAGILRIAGHDNTAVFIDVRPQADFAKRTISGAVSAPVDDVVSGKMKKPPFPLDDFNRRIVLFGADGKDARKFADYMTSRPWHNVVFYAGGYDALAAALKQN